MTKILSIIYLVWLMFFMQFYMVDQLIQVILQDKPFRDISFTYISPDGQVQMFCDFWAGMAMSLLIDIAIASIFVVKHISSRPQLDEGIN